MDILKFKMSECRWFSRTDNSDLRNIVLNETAVREFNLKPPILGKRFNTGQIIGIVKDFHYKHMHGKIAPVVFKIGNPRIFTFLVQSRPEKGEVAVGLVKKTWKAYFPGDVCNLIFAVDELDKMYQDDQRAFDFTKTLSGLAVLLCSVGLFGMTLFTVEQRKKEIGIRKLLGSSVGAILALTLREFLKLVFIGVILASIVATWAMSRWLQGYEYRIALTWLPFVIAGMFALCLTLITVGLITLRAAISSQIHNLRSN